MIDKHEAVEILEDLVRKGTISRRRMVQAMAGMGLSVAGAAAVGTAVQPRPVSAAQDTDLKLLTVSEEQQATWIKNFNPLLPVGQSRWPAQAGIYEPMAIHSMFEGVVHPWLATEWSYSEDLLTLTFKLREGVQWSDGTPFTSADVKFTFELLIANEALPGSGAIRSTLPLVTSIEAPDDLTVSITLSEVNTLTLYDFAEQMIVPKHIWENVEDPVTFLNDEGDPVGTGPFTVIAQFEAQYWELHKNPNYWQEGKPAFDGLRFPSYPTNDAANLANVNGENDWGGNFIPDAANVFVAQDPEHFHFWFAESGDMTHLFMNTTTAPFDNVDVRKAISMALDRELALEIGMYNYPFIADSSGLTGGYGGFKVMDESTEGAWVKRDVEAANALLDAAGYTLDGDVRVGPDGPMEYELNVVTGWSDWVSSVQIFSKNLEEIGVKATVTPLDFAAWFDRIQKGEFQMSLGWSGQGPTPFNYYRNVMATSTVLPVGEVSAVNWHRFGLPEADELLTALGQTSELEEQRVIVAQLQALYNEHAPGAPLWNGPMWGEYTTFRFEGFPNEENPWSALPTWDNPERLRVLTALTPVQEA
ncbi:MAG: ABC transporter substrate-binding protein [Thermomicrobiales bacterium]|nr:ABC transporter substrate-binding protein [Thermomicrobiales bacterium]